MTDSVAVALRVRPLVKSEVDRGCRISVQQPVAGVPQVTVNNSTSYTYNYVFDSADSQQSIYEACVGSRLKKLLEGFNVTILAYGQTGSGKTYTMGTAFNGIMDDDVGIIPRAVYEIFEETAAMAVDYDFKITCSFVELYQEQFFDLFSPKPREESTVDIREDKNRIFIPGLTEVEVTEAIQVTDQLMRGSSGRAVASTAMNETSSRSHAIFTLTVVATKKTGQQSVATSKFNLVDLAGSERCSKTHACGDRFKEGVNINKGLLALGNVINVLGSGQAASYVPYRQSKLTRLLQDSLGGNSITLMIACVSPADYNVAETLSTLRYADRALQIKNKPVVNVDPHAAEVMMLKDIIQKLRIELLSGGGGSSGVSGGDISAVACGVSAKSELENRGMREQLQQAEQKIRRLQKELQQALIDLADKEMQAHISEVNHDKLKARMVELKAKLHEAQELKAQESKSEKPEHEQTQLEEHLREITQLIGGVDDELQQREEALMMHRKECCLSTGGSSASSLISEEETHELLQSRVDEHTTKQLNLNGELRDIIRQLDLKQELHDRVTLNFSKLHDNDSNDEKVKEYQVKVEQLESERRELLDQLRTTKSKDNSAKLAEERRKRLQVLENELTDMRRKIVQQANMLKMREKEREKIKNLSSEIRMMKESKVKLIRAMRVESERFRQWKMLSEKQLTQLKSKDRKMQSEMVRQQNLHANQRQVLKRKCEEALAINKRLKDALERQGAAQAQRQRHAKDPTGGGAAKLDALLDRELEVILSLVDAEHSLEQLMEDRAIINAHCTEIKEQPVLTQEQAALLASLEEEIEMRNAQIVDLQQKVCSNDLDTRLASLCENVHSLGESRAINSKLLKSLVQQRREQAQFIMERKVLLDEQRCQLNDALQRHVELSKQLRLAQSRHEELLASEKRSYEEKVAVLLRGGTLGTEQDQGSDEQARQQIIEELLCSKEALEQELDRLKSKRKGKGIKTQLESGEYIFSISDTTDLDEEEFQSDDPDWVPRKRKRSKNPNSSATSNNNNTNNNTNNNSNNNTLQTSKDLSIDETSRKSSNRCRCRTECNTKRCGCVSLGNSCSKYCKCHGQCQNPINNKENSMNGDGNASLEATVINSIPKENNENAASKTFISTGSGPAVFTSPKRNNSNLPRSSQILLDTPSAKQKFF